MSPARILLALSLFAISVPSQAVEPEELVNKFLDKSVEATSSAGNDSIPIPSVLRKSLKVAAKPKTSARATTKKKTPTLADPPVRLAETPRSVLRLGDENKAKPLEIKPVPESVASTVDDEKVAQEVKRMESSINRRMESLQRSLEREEKQLERRFSDLATKREKALEKSDEKTLKRIETLEKQAVADYEKRVNRLLSAMATSQPSTVQKPVANQRSSVTRRKAATPKPATSRAPNWNRKPSPSRAAGSRTTKPQPAQQKRRFKLWPFR